MLKNTPKFFSQRILRLEMTLCRPRSMVSSKTFISFEGGSNNRRREKEAPVIHQIYHWPPTLCHPLQSIKSNIFHDFVYQIFLFMNLFEKKWELCYVYVAIFMSSELEGPSHGLNMSLNCHCIGSLCHQNSIKEVLVTDRGCN